MESLKQKEKGQIEITDASFPNQADKDKTSVDFLGIEDHKPEHGKEES